MTEPFEPGHIYPDPSQPDPAALPGGQIIPDGYEEAKIAATVRQINGAFADPPLCDSHGQRMRPVYLAGTMDRVPIGFECGDDCPDGPGDIFIVGE